MEGHILVIDDDTMNLRVAGLILRDAGFKVSCVPSGTKALSLLWDQQPDLILLDVHMPGTDGFAVMRILQAHPDYRNIPVIFLTADNEKETEIEGFRMGAVDFITKPFVAELMIARVNRTMQLSKLQKNMREEVRQQTQASEERRRKVERISTQVMRVLAKAIDAKDSYTQGHSMRVAKYAQEIARRAGCSFDEQRMLYQMGLLHDIGRIGINDAIINKVGKYSDTEFIMMRQHPTIGAEILQVMTDFPQMSIGAHWHHERYDGHGYPDGLKGDEIPWPARILAVADAYDAMTSTRSYRESLPQPRVRQEIERCSGTQFAPKYAEILLDMIDEDKEYKLRA